MPGGKLIDKRIGRIIRRVLSQELSSVKSRRITSCDFCLVLQELMRIRKLHARLLAENICVSFIMGRGASMRQLKLLESFREKERIGKEHQPYYGDWSESMSCIESLPMQNWVDPSTVWPPVVVLYLSRRGDKEKEKDLDQPHKFLSLGHPSKKASDDFKSRKGLVLRKEDKTGENAHFLFNESSPRQCNCLRSSWMENIYTHIAQKHKVRSNEQESKENASVGSASRNFSPSERDKAMRDVLK